MGLFRRPKSPYWWIHVPRDGQRPIRKSTNVRIDGGTKLQTKANLDLAKAILSIEEAAVARERYGLTETLPAEPGAAPTLEHFVTQAYEPWVRRERPDTAEHTLRRLKALFFPMFRHVPLTDIRPVHIEAWRAQRRGVEKRSINRELTYLLGVLGKAVELDVIAASPLDKLRIDWEPSPEIIRYLSAEEEARLLRALAVRDAAWIAARERFNRHRAARGRPPLPVLPHFKDWLTPVVVLALHAGLRRKELFTLTWDAIDWTAGAITITARTAKNKKYVRRVPLNARSRATLEGWQQRIGRTEGYVFVSRTGQRLTYVQSSWDKVLAEARITRFRWHDLRHTFASWLVQRGVRLEVVQRLCGHQSLKTTMRYAHLAPSQLTEAIDKLSA